jgi:hypothetical protein
MDKAHTQVQGQPKPLRQFTHEPVVKVESFRLMLFGREQVDKSGFAFPRLTSPTEVGVVVGNIER